MPRGPLSVFMPRGLPSSSGLLVTLLVLLAVSGCSRKEKSAPAAATAEQHPDGSSSDADEAASNASKAQASTLAEATPEVPLRPEPPKGSVTRNGPQRPPSGPPKLDGLSMPDGFSISVYSSEVPNARSLARGPKGVVFVSTRRSDRIYALVDADDDGKAEKVHIIATGLETPNGIAYRDGDLYIAEIGRILILKNVAERLERPPAPKVLADDLPKEEHHGWRYIRFSPDGKLYMPIGAPCDNCKREDPVFASITTMQPDGSEREVFAHGVRNSVGFDWHPETHELWFTENGRDELGNDLPPDELNRAPKPGLHFGYPHCHAGVIVDPEYGEGQGCKKFVPPAQNLGPHVAALGMRFYNATMFPTRYQGAVLIAEHGSWNRDSKIGYRVMFVPIEGNRATGYEPLVSGFLDDGGQVRGRPVDLEVLEDGSLLISDDWRGAVYRLSYEGG